MIFKKRILKKYMNLFSRIGKKSTWEGYNIARNAATEEEKVNALLQISKNRFEESKRVTLDSYFRCDLKEILKGKDVLEIGSNHGGASLAYFQLYGLKTITGMDTTKRQAEISKLFFKSHGIDSNFDFMEGRAEKMNFPTNTFDAIISFDVFEHVEDLSAVMSECFRVLRPNGKLLLAFPSYYHPVQHHLSNVTRAPCVHWFFPPQDIMDVFYDILDDNPVYRDKTGLKRRPLMAWEKLHIINGVTLKKFRSIIGEEPWSMVKHIPLPLFSTGELINKYPFLRILTYVFWFGTRIPILEELTNHRIVYILTK